MKRVSPGKRSFGGRGRKLGGTKTVPLKKMDSISDSVFRFFDRMPHLVLVEMSKIWQVPEILALASCSKTLNLGLSHNLVWQHRAKSDIPEYLTIHPLDLKRMQQERFWKTWYLMRALRPMPIHEPKFYKTILVEDEMEIGEIEVLLPEVGSLCYINKTTTAPPGVWFGFIPVTTKVYYVVLEQKLNTKGFPISYRMSKIETNEIEALEKRKTKYRRVEEITVRCDKSGYLSNHISILDISLY